MSAEAYVSAVKAMGLVERVGADLGYYQGDYVMLVQDEESYGSSAEWGLVVIGYGSCSGCDEWYAATSALERAALVVDLLKAARWFATLDEAKAYVTSDDELLKWHGHEDGWPGFVQAVQALVGD